MPNSDGESRLLSYAAATGLAVAEEMRVDPDVFVVGQNIARGGWRFGVSTELLDEFGPQRIRDSGISEPFEAGLATGAALVGGKPIVDLTFGDFALLAAHELYHQLPFWRYMHGLDQPMTAVMIVPTGIMGAGAGPEHSGCPEVLGMHFPGLKVVTPATPADAKGLMKAAIREPNPVLFHSVQSLLWTKSSVPTDPDFIVPIGRAVVRHPGDHVSLVTFGSMVPRALEAARQLASEGTSVEVIDLRSLVPLDWDTVHASVRKTHRAVVVHEAHYTAGPGAEIAARVQETLFFELDAPVLRVAGKDVPKPQDMRLEALCIPSVDDIVVALRHVTSL